jgi:hypothetical protein
LVNLDIFWLENESLEVALEKFRAVAEELDEAA